VNRLIEKRGRDAKIIDWLDEITATWFSRDMGLIAIKQPHNRSRQHPGPRICITMTRLANLSGYNCSQV
jgi:hypothetical protein